MVIASSGPITVGIPALVARCLRGRPLVFEVRDLWPEGAIALGVLRGRCVVTLSRAFERLMYRRASLVVVASPDMAKHVNKHGLVACIVVVPNAADLELFGVAVPADLPQWAEGKHLALYTGTLGLIDNCGQLIEAAARLLEFGRMDIEFVLIGDGREREELEEEVRAKGLTNVHFLGPFPKTEVARWVVTASCMLLPVLPLPFLDTASPNKLFDAFAAGIPVVQTTQGWIKNLLETEGCGITVPPNDAQAMANAIIRLVDDPDFRGEMAGNARRVAREQFDRDLLAVRMLDALRGAAGEEV